MNPNWLTAAGISGFLCVAIGAFGAHGLKDVLDAYGHGIYETAVQYHMFHTFALLGVGLLQAMLPNQNYSFTGWCFVLGLVLFCGSLYTLSISQIKWLGAVTPFGGTAFLIGWASLTYTVVKVKRHSP